MLRTFVAMVTVAALLLAGAPAEAARATAAAGSAGLGDPYYPDYGNGGYDVSHYDIRLRYNPATDQLSGTTTILATATQNLTSFDLDFVLTASSIRVNGYGATFVRRGDHELVVTAPRPITKGQSLTVVVQYAGVPSQVEAAGFTAWTRTTDGALAIGEPEIAWWWFPSNDHPLDKATFDISVLVPDGVEVLSNGVQVGAPRPELVGWSRWYWRSTRPMATYLAFLTIGQFEIHRDVAPNGLPVITAYSDLLGALAEPARASIERTAEIIDWESGILGDYPFEAEGGVVVPSRTLGYALENQTRPVYDAAFFPRGADPYVVVHENAHQWFGDSVSVHHWQDIWLNEGFATYLEWLWSDATGEGTTQEQFDFNYQYYYDNEEFWQVKVGDPGVPSLFDDAVYYRGAMALQQLRRKVGDTAFFSIVKQWVACHRYGNGTIAEFVTLANRVSGKRLDALFDTWLYRTTRPEVPGSAPASGAAATGGTERSATTARTTVAEPRSWSMIRAANERRPATH